MEAWDDDPQVRPVPIADDNGVLLPPAGASPRKRARRNRRPWLPLAVTGGAVVALIGAIALLGAVEYQDAPATDPKVFSLTTIADADTPQRQFCHRPWRMRSPGSLSDSHS
jgi:hypothetical protein